MGEGRPPAAPHMSVRRGPLSALSCSNHLFIFRNSSFSLQWVGLVFSSHVSESSSQGRGQARLTPGLGPVLGQGLGSMQMVCWERVSYPESTEPTPRGQERWDIFVLKLQTVYLRFCLKKFISTIKLTWYYGRLIFGFCIYATDQFTHFSYQYIPRLDHCNSTVSPEFR